MEGEFDFVMNTWGSRLKPSILLIEDDPIDALFVSRFLRSLDNKLVLIHKTSVEDALELLDDSKPSDYVIITDLQLPGKSGHELLEILRSSRRMRDAVVFIVSSSTNEEDVSRAHQQKVSGYFSKEVPKSDFMNALNAIYCYSRTAILP